MPRKKNPLLTVKELAKELDMSPDTIYRWVATGKTPIEVLRLNGAIRFRRSDLERLLYGETPSRHPEEAA